MTTSIRRRLRGAASAVVLAGVLASMAGLGPATPVRAATTPSCTPRLLVLSAFPAEIGGLLAAATVNPSATVNVDGRNFYTGRLAGNDVVLALTGIGLVNANRTAQAAVDHFRCGATTAISGIVFSGVAGGRTYIGDVTVPARWTEDGGATWLRVDPTMLSVARGVAGSSLPLERDAPLGDPACACIDPHAIKPLRLPHVPTVIAGGDGTSADPFGGRAFFCVPSGGDVFGCAPCRPPAGSAPDVPRFATGVLPFVDPAFFLSYFNSPSPPTTSYDASDMETAAVARVAARSHIPFIGFRAVSDGKGDPLMLPGFPFQFFVYRQLAADNAATVTIAFLRSWAGTHAGAHAAAANATAAVAPITGASAARLPDTSTGPRGSAVPALTLAILVAVVGRAARRRQSVRRETQLPDSVSGACLAM